MLQFAKLYTFRQFSTSYLGDIVSRTLGNGISCTTRRKPEEGGGGDTRYVNLVLLCLDICTTGPLYFDEHRGAARMYNDTKKRGAQSVHKPTNCNMPGITPHVR